MERVVDIGPLALVSGQTLPDVRIACQCYGELARDGRNAVLVTHGYTASHRLLAHGAGVAEGSWAALIGPGRALDPARHFIVCPNMLGSCYGSTGPASTDPRTGRRYGPNFPAITFSDIVASQRLLLQALGVTHLRAVVGPSMGGFQALQWAVDHPDWVDVAAAVVSAPHLPPSATMRLDWLAGWKLCDAPEGSAAQRAKLVELRVATLRSYGMDAVLRARGVPDAAVPQQLTRMAQSWAGEFDAHSLGVLLRAALAFDVRAALPRVRADVLLAVARSDSLFPPDSAVHAAMRRIQGELVYLEMDTPFGHSSSGPEHRLWAGELARLLQKPQ